MPLEEYVLLDGGQVGLRIEGDLLRNSLAELYFFSQDLNESIARLSRAIRRAGGLVYLAGGDNVLASVSNLERLLRALRELVPSLPCSFSIGIGEDLSTAHIALRVAKARGPGSIVRARRTLRGLRLWVRSKSGAWVQRADRAGVPAAKRGWTKLRRPSKA